MICICADKRGRGEPVPAFCFEPKGDKHNMEEMRSLVKQYYADRLSWLTLKEVDIWPENPMSVPFARVDVLLLTESGKEIKDKISFIRL